MAVPMARVRTKEHVVYHRDGSVWGRGQKTAEGVMCGFWEWFRKDGTKMRSGYFENGEQVGEWTTYDRKGRVVKVTQMKAKPARKPADKKPARVKPAAQKSVKKPTNRRTPKR
jgi:hypothetical protein